MNPIRTVSPATRRWTLLILAAASSAAMGLAAYVQLQNVARDLSDVRIQLEQAVDLADSGDISAAAAQFAAANRDAASATDRVDSPPVRLVGSLPGLRSTIASTIASAEAVHLVARAGEEVTTAIANVPGGLDAITLAGDGSVWLDASANLQEPLSNANAILSSALSLVQHSPEHTLSERVDTARRDLLAELERIVPVIDDVAAMTEVLPELFGAETERRYFLGAQNPAELRGTGGLIGAYAIMSVSDGQISISSFRPVQELRRDLFSPDVAPSEEFYDRYRLVIDGPGTWLNVNFSPHFPSVAETIERMYRLSEGSRLDGTIVVDPFALQDMLRETGPIDVSDSDIGRLRSDTVVDYVVNEAPLQLGFGEERKEILGDAARAVLDQFLSGSVAGRSRISALARSIAGGHILIHAASPEVQQRLERIGVTGDLPNTNQSVLAVSINNTAESKADYWLNQTANWTLTLDPDGTATGHLQLVVANDAPNDPTIPRYIMGAGARELLFGESRPYITVMCGTCLFRSVTYDDNGDFGVRHNTEQHHNFADVRPRVPLGEQSTIDYVMEMPHAWRRSGQGGVMDLEAWTPPQIRAAEFTVTAVAPPGWEWVDPEREGVLVQSPSRLAFSGTGRIRHTGLELVRSPLQD